MRGHLYELPENSELVIGRGANFDIVIEEDMVSRRHAKITTFHHEIVIQDLNSTNGTIVNQQRVEGGLRLNAGDLVSIGSCLLELISPSEVALAHQQMAAQMSAHPSPHQASPQAGFGQGAGQVQGAGQAQGGGMSMGGAFPPPAPSPQSFTTTMAGTSPLTPSHLAGGYQAQQHAQPLGAPQPQGYTPAPPAPPASQSFQPSFPQNNMSPNHMPPNNMGQTGQMAQGGGAYPPPPQAHPPHQTPNLQGLNGSDAGGGNFYGGGSAGGFNSLAGMRPRSKNEMGTFPSQDVADVIVLIDRLVERRHDGIVVVTDHDDREGSVYLRAGRVYFASVEDPHHFSEHPLHPLQSLIRICGWAQGSFKVKSSSALPTFESELTEESRALMDTVRQSCAELKSLRAQLPPLNTRLAVPTPLTPPLSQLNSDQLNAFQLCMNHTPIQQVIDFHHQGEREGIRTLLSLLEAGYLVRM